MEPIEVEIHLSADVSYLVDSVLAAVRIPFGGLVYAGICLMLTHPEFNVDLNGSLSQGEAAVRKVKLSKFVVGEFMKQYSGLDSYMYSAAVTHMAIIGSRRPDLLDKWYRFRLPGSGSGKISKTQD